MRFVFVAINGIGLGHLRRTCNIARAVRDQEPTADICVVTNSPVWQMLHDSDFDVVTPFLPWQRNRTLRREYKRVAYAALEAAVVSREPDAVIYDYLYWRSLLERIKRRSRALQILILRHRVGDSTRRLYSFEAKDAVFDAILVPHDKAQYRAHGMPRALWDRLTFVGPIIGQLPSEDTMRRVRSRYSPGDQALIVVTAGGGGAEECVTFLRESSAAAVSVANTLRNTVVVVVTGPLCRAEELLERSGRSVHVVPYVREMSALIGAADAVVALAGYNTTHEILASGVPSVLVPKQEGRDDQSGRVKSLAREGFVLEGRPNRDDIAKLLLMILQGGVGQTLRGRLSGLPTFCGAGKAASAIVSMARAVAPLQSVPIIADGDLPSTAAESIVRSASRAARLETFESQFLIELGKALAKVTMAATTLYIAIDDLAEPMEASCQSLSRVHEGADAMLRRLTQIRDCCGPSVRVKLLVDDDDRAEGRSRLYQLVKDSWNCQRE